jgi:ABC-2 type transport system permease protein
MFIALTANVKSWEAHVAIMNLLNLPLMFSSNVLYPTKLMPDWLKPFASVNPLSFAADALRQASLYGATADLNTILLSFVVLLIFAIGGILICAAIAEKTLGEG